VLQRFFDFDHMLVIAPSRLKREYLLCRRRQHSAGLGDVAMLDNKHPDTNMCIANRMMPIAPLKFGSSTVIWTESGVTNVLNQLRARDTWQLSGGPQGDPDAVVDAIEASEKAQEERERAAMIDGFRHRARDAWRSLLARTGLRNKRASDYHGVARAK
jgi:hypothetical protein